MVRGKGWADGVHARFRQPRNTILSLGVTALLDITAGAAASALICYDLH